MKSYRRRSSGVGRTISFRSFRQSFPLRIFYFLKYRNRVRKKRFTRIKFPRKVETVSVYLISAQPALANLFSIRGNGKIAIKFHFILRARARFIVRSNCLPSFQCTRDEKKRAILKSLEIVPLGGNALEIYLRKRLKHYRETTMGDQNSTAFHFYSPPLPLFFPLLLRYFCPSFSLTTRVIIVLCNYRFSRLARKWNERSKQATRKIYIHQPVNIYL